MAPEQRIDDSIRNDVFENVPAAVRPHVCESALPKAAIARDLIRAKPRRDTDIPIVDIYINKPGLAAVTSTALMYKSTTRNSLIRVEAWMAFATIEASLREI